MKIMSFNVLCGVCDGVRGWKSRKDYVVEMIKRYSPDTFGVQEAHYNWMKVFFEGIPEYGYVGVGRDDGKNEGEFSAVFYKKEKFDLIDSGSFWLSETPDRPGKGWDAACVRLCSWAKLREKDSGKQFVHFNTHLDHVGIAARRKGAELVTKKAVEINPDGISFFTGDFNVTPDSEPYKTVISGGFRDSRLVSPITEDTKTFHVETFVTNDENDHCIIDYCFVKGDVNVKSYKVLTDVFDGDKFASDHHPVLVDVDF